MKRRRNAYAPGFHNDAAQTPEQQRADNALRGYELAARHLRRVDSRGTAAHYGPTRIGELHAAIREAHDALAVASAELRAAEAALLASVRAKMERDRAERERDQAEEDERIQADRERRRAERERAHALASAAPGGPRELARSAPIAEAVEVASCAPSTHRPPAAFAGD